MFDIAEHTGRELISGPPAVRDFADVGPLLAPRSVAVVGASDERSNLGGTAVRLLGKFGYPGRVWPVHPKHETVGGLPCYARLADLPEPPDLTIFAVAAARLTGAVAEAIDAGARHGIAWAGGFAEVGEQGAALQRQLAALCGDRAFTLLGPNCLGVIDTRVPLAATFASFLTEQDVLLQGGISAVGQSGGLMTMAQALAQQRGFGFRTTVSTGNEAVIGVADFIHAFAADEQTRVIVAYLEGARDPELLLAALAEARAAGKPVVLLRGGATATSAQAAAAHTGALAGEDRVWRAVLRGNAIQVRSLEELLDVALHLSGLGGLVLPAGRSVAVVTFGGGSGVLSADQCEAVGLAAPPLASTTVDALAELVPPTASVKNPVDVTPVTFTRPEWLAKFPATLDAIAADPGIDAVLVQCGPMAQGGPTVAEALADFAERSAKTVSLAWPLAPQPVPEILRARGVHCFSEYARAIGVVATLAAHREAAAALDTRAAAPAPAAFDWTGALPGLAAGAIVSEADCHRALAAAGLPVAAGELATGAEEAAAAGERVGWPVALKAISPRITHRAASGLLALRLRSAEEVEQAFRALADRAAALGVTLDGVYVQHMEEQGDELIVSAFRDPTFGLFVSCGAGGVLTELIDDVVLERAPLDAGDAATLLRRLRTVPDAAEIGAVAAFVASFSRVAAAAPWARFVLELNPVKWTPSRAVAVDGLMIVQEM